MIRAVDWKRNLAALWFAEFTAIFGFSFAFPFLPVFLHTELGIQGQSELAIWTGVVASASGFALAIASPIWGVVADRYGKTPMLIRAMIGGAISVGLMGLARNPYDLLLLRFLQGATSGTIAAATALVASETPREKVGWALGVLSSSVALGGAIGPLLGGLAGSVFGLRAIFVAGGVLLLASAVPVVLIVRETPRSGTGTVRRPALEVLRETSSGTLRALGFLMGAQALIYVASSAAQQLFVLRMLSLARVGATLLTGIAFGAAGLAQAAAAAFYSGLARRTGYLRLSIVASALVGVAYVSAAMAPTAPLEVAAVAFSGLLVGAITPALSSMMGLETPPEVQARVFGVSSSATAIGFAVGPLVGGGMAAAAGVPMALVVAAAISILLAVVLSVGGREPVR